MVQEKACTKCGEVKPLDAFWGATKGAGGKQAACADCCRAYRERNKVKLREYWNERQREVRAKEKAERILYAVPLPENGKVCCRCKRLRDKSEFHVRSKETGELQRQCKPCKAELSRAYNAKQEGIDKRNAARNKRRATNLEASREIYRKEYRVRLSIHGPMHLLRSRISSGMRRSIDRGGKAGRSAFSLLDFSPEELKIHLERQFIDGMGWHNFSDWDIDHIVPLDAYDISSVDDEDFKRAWALTNLRPLWRGDNRRKSATRTHLI